MNYREFQGGKHPAPRTRVCVWQIDGSARHFFQIQPEALHHAIGELHSGHLFSQDRITLVDEDSEDSFFPPRVTRIDLVTDQVTVWDFPFSFGALLELTEGEFTEGVRVLSDVAELQTGTRLFIEIETVDAQRLWLLMEVVAGFPAARMAQVFSLFTGRQLIFGLNGGGVGVLNLSNVARFAIHPKPVPIAAVNDADGHRVANPDLRHARPAERELLASLLNKNGGVY